MRKKYIAANWKMNKLPNEAINYINNISPLVKNNENEIIVCVPYVDLFYVLLHIQGTNIKVGAQNVHWEENGAFTGEISAQMLKSIGVEYVIIGHSERRMYFNETDEIINKKLKAAINNNLKAIFCIGESLEERQNNLYEQKLSEQIKVGLEGIKNNIDEKVIIAYEPIWAIGTGKTATKEDANNTIKFIRKEIRNNYGDQTANNIIIQYGGSVKSTNAKELFCMSDIDGGLIGGASLDENEFSKIVNFNKV